MASRSGPAEPDSENKGVVPVSDLSYADASRELDAIVEFFEQRDVDIDLLVARLARATDIVDELDRRIHKTRMQVEELVPKLEGVGRSPRRTDTPPEGYDDKTGSDDGQYAEDPAAGLAGSADVEPSPGDRPLF